ncbi:sensor histidine kinase [Labedaea rhizosphaerae]|uniref:histidine kinase n=1 Tax=Labedaea rhizosphaerae TaxID=598644 RepID=A0A4V3CZF8_LABRH|nr:sensor histidine kinase [Labedaea rhizosphaerae]TDP97878.1 two-component system CitB family sensor kinase [Labedaea rhizosphaerae]
MSARKPRFARQILALQIGLVTLVLGVAFSLVGWLLDKTMTDQFEQRALAVARLVAADPQVRAAVAADDPGRVLPAIAERNRAATMALFVVITDDRGIRLAHPDPGQIGRLVSTDPSGALAGKEVLTVERGTLGLSARAKVPVRDGNRIVGEVSVGFDAEDVQTALMNLLGVAALVAGVALLLGVLGSWLLTWLLKRRTLGLEPHELAELVQEHEAVLHGVDQGVFAVDADGKVSVCNEGARRLLGPTARTGVPVDEVDLPGRLRAVLAEESTVDNMITVAGDKVLVVNSRQVERGGRRLGVVVTLRDRTDLETLTRELDSVRGLTDGLRAQRHEFANRLHALSGLLQMGHHAEAVEYLQALSSGPIEGLGAAAQAVRDPVLQSFLAAKTSAAAEKDVRLDVGETSWVPGRVRVPLEVTTVLGNLVDNALDAARVGARSPAWVEVDLLADGDTLHVSVSDSGGGVPAPLRDTVFHDGVSTKDSAGHGLGLALARQAARSLGGDVRLADPGGRGGGSGAGAVFVAVLPTALVVDTVVST